VAAYCPPCLWIAGRGPKVSHMICEASPRIRLTDCHGLQGDRALVRGHWVKLDKTAQPFGGFRSWFLCPRCDRRCAILYPLQCRQCAGLHYHSEHLSPQARATLKAKRLRNRLGGRGQSLPDPIPAKPKWMRWHTYLAKRAEIRDADHAHVMGCLASLPHLAHIKA
jgi:hypothetical protein